MDIIHRCPKCGTRFDPPKPAASECPSCGVWFHKCLPDQADSMEPRDKAIPLALPAWREAGLAEKILTPRGALLLFLTIWGLRLAAASYQDAELAGTFMHLILLPIHEAGHIFLIPFGEFLTILGGSFFQLALPLGIGTAFLIRQNDPFGAAVCLWWAGASLVDLSPYVWDSLHPQLMLLGGHTGEEGGHDWIYLLEHFGVLRHAHFFGAAVHHIGTLTMAAGIAWGLISLPGPKEIDLAKLIDS